MTAGVRDGAKINIAETNAYREMQAAQQAHQAAAAQQQYAAAQQVRNTGRYSQYVERGGCQSMLACAQPGRLVFSATMLQINLHKFAAI